jgi:hypothetical protein
MAPLTSTEVLDRHALVLTIWLTAGFIAATLFHFGLGPGGPPFILAAFAALIAGFVGHIIVNAVIGSGFTARELALGLVLYAVGLIVLGAVTLASRQFAATAFLPTSIGFLAIFATFIFYLVAHSGVRSTFEAFDVVRSFRAIDHMPDDSGPQAQ